LSETVGTGRRRREKPVYRVQKSIRVDGRSRTAEMSREDTPAPVLSPLTRFTAGMMLGAPRCDKGGSPKVFPKVFLGLVRQRLLDRGQEPIALGGRVGRGPQLGGLGVASAPRIEGPLGRLGPRAGVDQF
jgi:hypothetical protein